MESKGDRNGNDDADECDFQLVVQDFLPVVAEDGSCVYEENRPGREMNVRTPGRRRPVKMAIPPYISNQSLAAIIFLAVRPPLAVCFNMSPRPPL